MSFWILAGLVSALALSSIIAPLRKRHKRLAVALTFLLPLAALGLYWWIGNPEFTQ